MKFYRPLTTLNARPPMIAKKLAAHPKHKLLWLLIFVFGSCIINFHSFASSDCETVEYSDKVPSSGRLSYIKIAHLVCSSGFGSGSEEYWVEFFKPSDKISGKIVFKEFSHASPDVKWIDEENLTIILPEISTIEVAYNIESNINIKYAITCSVSSDVIRERVDDTKKRMLDMIDSGSLTVSGGSKDAEKKALGEIIDRQKREYEAFYKQLTSLNVHSCIK